MKTASKKKLQFVEFDRLAEEVVGASAHRPQCIVLIALPRDNDDLGGSFQGEQAGERLQAFLGFIWTGRQAQVENCNRGALRIECFKRRYAIPGQ